MPSSNFYPAISELIPTDKIPSELGPVKDGIQNIFNKIFYKDLISEVSQYKDVASYKLTLLSYGRIGFDIPGTGLSILVNPDDTASSITPFPIQLRYNWEVIKYVNEFKSALFSSDATAFFNLFLEIIDVDNSELIEELINIFFNDPNPVQKFVDAINSKYNPSTPIAVSTDPEVDIFEDIITQLTSQSIDTISVIFNDYINAANSFEEIFNNLKKLFEKWFGDFSLEDFKKFLTPKVELDIDDLAMGIEFPRSVFIPVATSSYHPGGATIGDPLPDLYKTLLKFNIGSLTFSTENGYEFNGESSFDFQKSFILGTKFTLELHDMKLDLSRTKNIPEATADGRPDDFIGVYIKEGIVGFPADWNHDAPGMPASTGELYVDNLLAGTGGISGTIGLRGTIITPATGTTPAVRHTNPLISVRFGEKFEVSLDTFSITFQQNAIIESDIQGMLTVPGMHDGMNPYYKIRVKIHISGNGDFYITASAEDGIPYPLHFLSYFTFDVKSLTIGRRSNKFYLATAGTLSFSNITASSPFINDLLPKDIEIQKLLIWENGQIELEGGTIELRKPVKINIGPVKLTVTAIGMGNYEKTDSSGNVRKYKYVEFSAGISINPGGVDARGDGVHVYFSVDGGPTDIFIRIRSIAIDIIIPGSASKESATLLLSGYLSMREPSGDPGSTAGTEYAGGIDFTLPKLKMGGSAAMKYNPSVPSFLIDVSLELSTPIVLGATGMGIYGFRALFGKQYIVSKTAAPVSLPADAEWWQYYKKKVSPEMKEGVTVSKMANEPGFSFGAGVSLATAADGGKTFSSKIFFLLSLPEVFLLQGQAQILKERIGLDTTTDPPFYALLAIDPTSISSALGVSYKFPESGKIATVDALIEMAYFWHDSSAWYLNIGRDQPADRRVQARIFQLFDVYSYFMLSASGIRAGAGASFDKTYKAGPVKAHLYAYMDVAGRIAFKPVQVGGSIDIGGGVDITLLGKGFSLTAAASLAAEAPKPFIVTGSVEVCVKILKKKYCIDLDFTWTFDSSLDYEEVPMFTSGIIGAPGSPVVNNALQEGSKTLNMMSQDTLNLLCIDQVAIPVLPATTASTIPSLSDSTWAGIDNYLVPLDSYIDIEFRKGVKPNGDASLNRFGGVTSGANYSVYVAPQRGKSNRVRHDFILNKVEIFSWNPGSSVWEPYHVYNAITPLADAPFSLTSATLDNLKFGHWQIDSPGNYTKLRIMAQNPLSFLSQGSADTVAEELGVTNAIFCPPPAREKTCVNFDGMHIFGPETVNIPAGAIAQQNGVLFRVTTHDGTVVYKPYVPLGIRNALQFKASDTLEIYLPEPMAEVSMLLTTLTNHVTISYYQRVHTGTDASGNPVYDYDLITSIVQTPVDLSGGVYYSDPLNVVDKITITGGDCSLSVAIPIVCDTDMSGELYDFIKLMNALAVDKQIVSTQFLSDDSYTSLVKKLSCFPSPLPGHLYYTGTATSTTLSVAFTSDTFNCNIDFTVVSPTGATITDWTTVNHFYNVRPDPAHPSVAGLNSYFLVDINAGGSVITMSARTLCFPTYECYTECMNFFYQVCYVNVVDYQYNQSLPSSTDVADNNTQMAEAINKTLLPVWRPDTTFAVRVEYTDEMYEEASLNNTKPHAFVLGFRTKGPIGHYHEYPTGDNASTKIAAYMALEAKDNQDQYKLATLQHYIDFSKSYPNADGSILGSKPLYYQNPQLSLFYEFPYVYQFYQDWASYNGAPAVGSRLEVVIKDPTEPPTIPDPLNPSTQIPNVITPTATSWLPTPNPIITADIAALNNMISNGLATFNPCLPSSTTLTPQGVFTQVPMAPLLPLKLYTAIYNASYNPASLSLIHPQVREVHRYGFQTSRYKDFNEHISSYILERDPVTHAITHTASYKLEKAFTTAAMTKALQVISGSLPATDALHAEAALDYDKLIDRIFEFKELEPAEFLQFNLVKDNVTNNVLGILIRNPEPLNDPKIKVADLTNALTMMVDTGSGYDSASLYKVLYSKDKASAFITGMDNLLNIPVGTHQFTFVYRLYDGSAYADVATETVTLDLSTL